MEKHNKRIESVDALRAFALFGVIMVHVNGMYSFLDVPENNFSYFTSLGKLLSNFVYWFFDDKSRAIFSTLFGVSFYLILRNPTYTISKFCWRCVLLMCFGLFDKLFSTFDILFWYGLNGLLIAAIPVRKMSPKSLLLLSIFLFIWGVTYCVPIKQFDFTERYIADTSLSAILTYPMNHILLLDVSTRLYIDGPMTLAYFVLGYYLGRSGIIDSIDNHATLKKTATWFSLFMLSLLLYKITEYNQIIWRVSIPIGATALSLAFIYLFNRFKPYLGFTIKYGRLGLTNYSSQYIFGTIMILYIAIPTKISIEYVFLLGICLFTFQCIFAVYWTKKHRFGPLEWLWRIATNRHYIPNNPQ